MLQLKQTSNKTHYITAACQGNQPFLLLCFEMTTSHMPAIESLQAKQNYVLLFLANTSGHCLTRTKNDNLESAKQFLNWLIKVKQGEQHYTGCTSIQPHCFRNKSGTQFTQAQSYVNVVMIMILQELWWKKDAGSALHTPQCKWRVGTPNDLYDSTPVLCSEPRSCRQLWACHETCYTRWMAHVFSSRDTRALGLVPRHKQMQP